MMMNTIVTIVTTTTITVTMINITQVWITTTTQIDSGVMCEEHDVGNGCYVYKEKKNTSSCN